MQILLLTNIANGKHVYKLNIFIGLDKHNVQCYCDSLIWDHLVDLYLWLVVTTPALHIQSSHYSGKLALYIRIMHVPTL